MSEEEDEREVMELAEEEESWSHQLSDEASHPTQNPKRKLRRGGGGRSSGGGAFGRSTSRSYGNCYGDRCSSLGLDNETGVIIGCSIAGVCGGVFIYVCVKAYLERKQEIKREKRKAEKKAMKELQMQNQMEKGDGLGDSYLGEYEPDRNEPIVMRDNNLYGRPGDEYEYEGQSAEYGYEVPAQMHGGRRGSKTASIHPVMGQGASGDQSGYNNVNDITDMPGHAMIMQQRNPPPVPMGSIPMGQGQGGKPKLQMGQF